jgi:glyoxylase-like metal-dependent hydrolase (beta-lactamase superfamily II)/rhodanese-related sulfurtransferase
MKEISTQKLLKLIQSEKDFVLLDCRGVDYFNWEHIENAVNLRWKYVSKKASKMLNNKKQLIITSCDGFTCNASIRCYKSLIKEGYKNIIEYSGGLADWKAHGQKTVQDKKYKISSNVYRFPDQTFYSESVNSYFIDEDDSIILIDGPQNLTEQHEDFIQHTGKPIKILLSHNPTAGNAKKLQTKYKAKIYLHENDRNGSGLTAKPDLLIKDGYRLSKNLTVIHTPGHSPGSVCLYDSNNKILFTGDHIQGNTKGKIRNFIEDDDGVSGDPQMRLKSTKKLLSYDFEMILPFHYELIRADAKEAVKEFVKKYEK